MTNITKALDELETATAFSSKSARDNHANNIAALRTALQDKAGEPMTEWEIADIFERWDNTSGASMSDFVRMVEAHHGITAKAEGEKP